MVYLKSMIKTTKKKPVRPRPVGPNRLKPGRKPMDEDCHGVYVRSYMSGPDAKKWNYTNAKIGHWYNRHPDQIELALLLFYQIQAANGRTFDNE